MMTETSKTVASNRKAIHAAGILIVQPDAELAAYWRDTLVDYGMSGVRVVGDAQSAIDSVGAAPPSGIVVALPPVPDGYDLVSRLREGTVGGIGETPIVLVMARATRTAVIAAATAGFDAVLPSPLHPRLIYRRMGSLMQRARRTARRRLAAHETIGETRLEEAGKLS